MADNVVASPVEAKPVSTNGKETTALPPPDTKSSELSALFKAETSLMVWLIFLAFGGGIMALYYARIRYLPDIEWSAALVHLGVGTIVGGTVALLFAMSLLLPGLIWSEFLIFDSKMEREKVFRFDNGKELCVQSIFKLLGAPLGLALLASHLSLVTGQYISSIGVVLLVYVAVSAISIAVVWRHMRAVFEEKGKPAFKEDGTPETINGDGLKLWSLRSVSWFTLSLVLSQISIVAEYVLSTPTTLSSFFALTFICTAGVLVSNHVVAMLYRSNPKQAILASLVAAGFLLFTADWFSPLSLRIMSYYGMGGGRTVDLVLTEDGSKVVGDLGFALCETRTVCSVEILSKLGDEYYLVVNKKTFTLPKAAVQSYRSSDPRPTK
jgi:hypothetical protein